MQTTIREAHSNQRALTVQKWSNGLWKITATIRNKRLSAITRDSRAIDCWNSEPDEQLHGGTNKKFHGYNLLLDEIIKANL